MEIAYVRWKDALQEQADRFEETAVNSRLCVLQEVGFFLGESDEAVTIGMEVEADGEVTPGRWRLHIPKAQIVELKRMPIEKFLKSRMAV